MGILCHSAVLIGPSLAPSLPPKHPQAVWAAALMTLSCPIKGHRNLQAVCADEAELEATLHFRLLGPSWLESSTRGAVEGTQTRLAKGGPAMTLFG